MESKTSAPRHTRGNEAQWFIDCAYYGYLGGLKAMLEADLSPSHYDWVEALQSAAIAQHLDIVDFLLGQFIAQKADIVVDSEWLLPIERRSVDLARKIEICDQYVKSLRLRAKLLTQRINAPEVEVPIFISSAPEKVYPFGKDRESDIVGDHSQRRRASMEANASERAASRELSSGWGAEEVIAVSSWMEATKSA